MKMKKIVSLMVFTLLVVVGYYVGTAVAQNNPPAVSNNMPADNVMVIEEEYDVITPAAGTPTQQPAVQKVKAPAASTDKTPPVNNNNPTAVETTVTEEGYIVEQ